MESDRTIGLCYSDFSVIDQNGCVVGRSNASILSLPVEWLLLWTNPIAHPSVMMRRSALVAAELEYRSETEPAEDYDLWMRMLWKTGFKRVPEPLISYRKHPAGVYLNRQNISNMKALIANRAFVSRLISASVPPFHKYLTSFGEPEIARMGDVDYRVLLSWYTVMFNRLQVFLNSARMLKEQSAKTSTEE